MNLNRALAKKITTQLKDMEILRRKPIALAMMNQWTWTTVHQTMEVGAHHKIIHLDHLLISLLEDHIEGVHQVLMVARRDHGKKRDIHH